MKNTAMKELNTKEMELATGATIGKSVPKYCEGQKVSFWDVIFCCNKTGIIYNTVYSRTDGSWSYIIEGAFDRYYKVQETDIHGLADV